MLQNHLFSLRECDYLRYNAHYLAEVAELADLPAGRQARTLICMYYVYVLYSKTKDIMYKGLTDNLDRRYSQHIKGRVKATKHILPVDLIHVELCASRIEARTVERYFKSGTGRESLRELLAERD